MHRKVLSLKSKFTLTLIILSFCITLSLSLFSSCTPSLSASLWRGLLLLVRWMAFQLPIYFLSNWLWSLQPPPAFYNSCQPSQRPQKQHWSKKIKESWNWISWDLTSTSKVMLCYKFHPISFIFMFLEFLFKLLIRLNLPCKVLSCILISYQLFPVLSNTVILWPLLLLNYKYYLFQKHWQFTNVL